jgi:hypothetical protein
MPSLSALPIELWLEIVKLLGPSGAPITGVNAGWTKLSSVCPPESTGIEPWHAAHQKRSGRASAQSALGNLRL